MIKNYKDTSSIYHEALEGSGITTSGMDRQVAKSYALGAHYGVSGKKLQELIDKTISDIDKDFLIKDAESEIDPTHLRIFKELGD